MGTRFVCAKEAGAPPRHQKAIVKVLEKIIERKESERKFVKRREGKKGWQKEMWDWYYNSFVHVSWLMTICRLGQMTLSEPSSSRAGLSECSRTSMSVSRSTAYTFKQHFEMKFFLFFASAHVLSTGISWIGSRTGQTRSKAWQRRVFFPWRCGPYTYLLSYSLKPFPLLAVIE